MKMNAIKIPVLHKCWTRSEIIAIFAPYVDVYRIDFWPCENKPDHKLAVLSYTGNFWHEKRYITLSPNENEQWLCVPFLNEIPSYNEPLMFLQDYIKWLENHLSEYVLGWFTDCYKELYEGKNNELCMINKHQLAYYIKKQILRVQQSEYTVAIDIYA